MSLWKKWKNYIIRPKFRRLKLQADIARDFKCGRLNDYQKEVEYIRKNRVAFFPYHFFEKYRDLTFDREGYDEDGMPYIEYNNKIIFFPISMNLDIARKYLISILIEQDAKSPHRYFLEEFKEKDAVFIDCGAAEGFLTLQYIEKVSKAYVIEGDNKWYAALRKTLAPWKEKIVFVDKYLDDHCCLDNICKEKGDSIPIIIKMDIEGAEMMALSGAKSLLCMNPCVLAICTYHGQNDYDDVCEYLTKMNYKFEASQGYCLWYFKEFLKYPYFRKCLVRGWRTDEPKAGNRIKR